MGLVFDHTGHYLYVSSADGSVLRYDLSLGKFDHAYELGGSLAGIDIAPDDSCLVVAQYYFGLEEGAFHKLDLLTERVTNITYSRVPNAEAGAQDVRIAANGLALVTTLPFSGTGCRPLRQIDLATNEISERSDVPGSCGSHIQSPILRRSADGTRLWIVEAGTYSTFAYTAATNSFGARVQRNQYILQPDAAVSRDGALFGMRLDSVASLESAPDSQPLHDFADCDGLIAFDATKDILYTTNSATDEIVAHDTNTFAELFRFNARTDISPGTIPQILAASHDGSRLAFIGNGGLFVYDVSNGAPPEPTPTPPGPTPTVTISVSPTQIVEGQSATFTVSASAVVTQALTVKFNLSGKAIPNWDYSFDLGTSIEIPAGQSSASIVVQAFVDSNPEKKEKATITLTPGTGYKLAGGKKAKPPKATLTILDPP
jgi:hypothetical protein